MPLLFIDDFAGGDAIGGDGVSAAAAFCCGCWSWRKYFSILVLLFIDGAFE